MLDFVTEADLTIADYYRGRWNYMQAAIEMLRDLAGDVEAEDVLELGPYLLPLVRGADTMDILLEANPSILHNAKQRPWPIADGRYGAFVALQVLEHLGPPWGDEQTHAFGEIRRVCHGPVIISVPYCWPSTQGWHGEIDERIIERWAGIAPDRSFVDRTTYPRIVCAWDRLS
jgi:hypothetical protein